MHALFKHIMDDELGFWMIMETMDEGEDDDLLDLWGKGSME